MSANHSQPKAQQAYEAALRQYTHTTDPIGIIVRGHLFIEQALNNLIRAYVYEFPPKPFKFDRALQLARMLELIDPSELNLLLHVNGLRNEAAHEHFLVQREDQDKLLTLFEAAYIGKSLSGAMTGWSRQLVDEYPLGITVMLFTTNAVLRTKATAVNARLPVVAPELNQRIAGIADSLSAVGLDAIRIALFDSAPPTQLPPQSTQSE